MKIIAKTIRDKSDTALILDIRAGDKPVKQFLFATEVSDSFTKAKVAESIKSLPELFNIINKCKDFELETKEITV